MVIFIIHTSRLTVAVTQTQVSETVKICLGKVLKKSLFLS